MSNTPIHTPTNTPIDPYREDLPSSASRPAAFQPLGIVMMSAALILILVVGWAVYQQQNSGTAAPDFRLPLLGEDGTFTLSSHRGQTVVINFWGSWCDPCRAEAPMLQNVYANYINRDVVFVGISVGDTEASALAFIEDYGITYPNVMDLTRQLERDFDTQGIVPQTLVINKNGEVVQRFTAQPPEAELRRAIEATFES